MPKKILDAAVKIVKVVGGECEGYKATVYSEQMPERPCHRRPWNECGKPKAGPAGSHANLNAPTALDGSNRDVHGALPHSVVEPKFECNPCHLFSAFETIAHGRGRRKRNIGLFVIWKIARGRSENEHPSADDAQKDSAAGGEETDTETGGSSGLAGAGWGAEVDRGSAGCHAGKAGRQPRGY